MISEESARWQTGLSGREKTALQDYTKEQPNYYRNINDKLRGKTFFWESGNHERAQAIHEALQRSSVPCDCTVYRGASNDALGKYRNLSDSDLVGKVLLDKGFMSTSTIKGSEFGGDVKLEILVPKGSKGSYLGNGISVAGESEHEMLFDKGSRLKVIGVYRDTFGNRVIQTRMM